MIGVHVERGAVICAGAVLKAGVRVDADSVFGIGAVVTKDVPSRTVVYGNPARLRYPVKVYEEKKRAWEEASSG